MRAGSTASAAVVANGRAGSGAIEVPPGSVTVSIELEPVETVGPLNLPPGTHVRIRVVDFYQSDPPWREVFVQPMDEAMPSEARVQP